MVAVVGRHGGAEHTMLERRRAFGGPQARTHLGGGLLGAGAAVGACWCLLVLLVLAGACWCCPPMRLPACLPSPLGASSCLYTIGIEAHPRRRPYPQRSSGQAPQQQHRAQSTDRQPGQGAPASRHGDTATQRRGQPWAGCVRQRACWAADAVSRLVMGLRLAAQ